MTKKRRRIPAELKAKVALAAARGDRTVNEIASQYKIHPTQVSQWKKQLQEEAREIFRDRRGSCKKEEEDRTAELYEQIGRLKMELDWLKKKIGDEEAS